MSSSTITLFISLLAFSTFNEAASKRPRAIGLPVPTSETIPLVAEVMGAASYEETVEPEETPPGNGEDVKRVQRKLADPEETDRDLDPEQLEFHEYQGVMGRPGVDFPVLPKIPRTDFSCRKVKSSGYYADLETGCQVFHICDVGRKISFLCPNGTIFRQSHLICDWWFRVDCDKSVDLYEESAEQLAHDQMVYKKRAEAIAKAMGMGRTPESSPTTPLIPTTVTPSKTSPTNRQGRRRQDRPPLENRLVVENKGGSEYPKNDFPSGLGDNEKQVVAETASFASGGRHRFFNNFDSNSKTQVTTSAQAQQGSSSQKFEGKTEEKTFTTVGYNSNADNQQFSGNQQFAVNPTYSITSNQQLPYSANQQQTYSNQQASSVSTLPSFSASPTESYSANYQQFTTIQQQPYLANQQTNSANQQFYIGNQQQTYTYTPTLTTGQYSDTWTQKKTPTTVQNYVSQSRAPTLPPSGSFPATDTAVFDGKLTSNKDYALLELQRQTVASSTLDPTQPPRQYAVVYNNSAVEEIRPEIVNSLVEGKITTPSAQSSETLASLYANDGRESSTVHPRVSDVVLGVETTVTPINSSNDLPSVLTQSTKDSYNSLFTEIGETDFVKTNDLTPHESNGILPGTPSPTASSKTVTNAPVPRTTTPKDVSQKLKDSVELRELAQVFSRALSAYLEDPEMFKEILAQVRPTEPNPAGETTPSPDDEVLDYSDTGRGTGGNVKSSTAFNRGNNLTTGPAEASTDSRTTYSDYTTVDMTTPSPEYVAQQTTGAPDDQSYFPTAGSVSDSSRPRYGGFHDNNRRAATKAYSPYGADLPENATTGSPLSSISSVKPSTTVEATTSFPTTHPDVLHVNNLVANSNLLYDQYTASGEDVSGGERLITADSQSFVGGDNYAAFADKFNSQRKNFGKDPSMEDSSYSSEDLVPYFGQEPPFESLAEPAGFNTQASSGKSGNDDAKTTVNSSTENRFSPPTTAVTVHTTPEPEIVRPTTYHPPHVSIATRQSQDEVARAKEMFGQLNETTASQLMAVMNQTDMNPSVKRLVLLLVSEKTVGNRTVEESRSKLIQALLTSRPTPPPRQARKSQRAVDSVVGNVGVNNLLPELNPSAKLYIPSGPTTTTAVPTTTIPSTTTTQPQPQASRLSASYPSDARAVELLKTLYNLAARWG